MRFHGIDAKVERAGNFLVGLALGDHLQYFALTAGQEVQRIGDMAAVIGEHRVGYGRAQVSLAFRYGAHGRDEVGVDGILKKVTAGAGAEDFTHINRVLMHAEGEHAGARGGGSQTARGFDTIQFGHGNVHYDDVRLKLFG